MFLLDAPRSRATSPADKPFGSERRISQICSACFDIIMAPLIALSGFNGNLHLWLEAQHAPRSVSARPWPKCDTAPERAALVKRAGYSARLRGAGSYEPGMVRNAMLSRFAPLMATIARVRFTISRSSNCERAI